MCLGMTLVRRQNNHIFENCRLSSGAKPSKNALKQQTFPHNWPFLACLWGDRNPENFNYVIYPPLFKGHAMFTACGPWIQAHPSTRTRSPQGAEWPAVLAAACDDLKVAADQARADGFGTTGV